MWLLIPVLLTLHVAVCLLLVLAILMQLPRSEGLGAAFGGGMTENIFGAQTTNVLSKFTVWLGVAFFVLTLFLSMSYARMPSAESSQIQKELLSAPVPEASPDAAPEAASAASPDSVTEAPPAEEVAPEPPEGATEELKETVVEPGGSVESVEAVEEVESPSASPAPVAP